MTLPSFLDITADGDVDLLVDDDTIGLLATHNPERLPESVLIDPERLERALIAVREVFDSPDSINIALVHNSDGDSHALALYPHDDRARAVILSPRVRPDDESDPELSEVETA